MSEIKDADTRASLQILPYEFHFKEPSSDCIKFGKQIFVWMVSLEKKSCKLVLSVSQFARKTGDYTNLSAVDLNLIALSYQLCKENMTAEEFGQLKQEPAKNHVIWIIYYHNNH